MRLYKIDIAEPVDKINPLENHLQDGKKYLSPCNFRLQTLANLLSEFALFTELEVVVRGEIHIEGK